MHILGCTLATKSIICPMMMIPYIHKLYCGRTRLQLPLSWKIITFYEHCHVHVMIFFLWWSQFSLFYTDYVCKMEDDTRYKNACMLSSRSSTILCIFCDMIPYFSDEQNMYTNNQKRTTDQIKGNDKKLVHNATIHLHFLRVQC